MDAPPDHRPPAAQGVQSRHAGLIYPGNRKILAYIRSFAGETILCVVNLSRNSQPVELQLQAHRAHARQLMGRTTFPPIGDLPYMLTLPGHGFYWFALADEVSLPDWHVDLPEPLPEFITLVMTHGWSRWPSRATGRSWRMACSPPSSATSAGSRPRMRASRASSSAAISRCRARRRAAPRRGSPCISRAAADRPCACRWRSPGAENLSAASPLRPFTLAKIRRGPKVGVLYDATAGDDLALDLLDGIRHARLGRHRLGRAALQPEPGLRCRRAGRPAGGHAALGRAEQHVADARPLRHHQALPAALGRAAPEVEIGRFLTDVAGFANRRLCSAVSTSRATRSATTLAAAFGFVLNQGDGWAWTLDHLARELETMVLEQEVGRALDGEPFGVYLQLAATIGQRTAGCIAFAPTDDPAFGPSRSGPPTGAAGWRASRPSSTVPSPSSRARRRAGGDKAEAASAFAEGAPKLRRRIAELGAVEVDATRTRLHGDYHLGQVLIAKGDIFILDFEGEPQRDLRRAGQDLAAQGRGRHAALARLRRLRRPRPLCRARSRSVSRKSGRWPRLA
ncbi:MAG: alpha-glucosidase C-terminal domain-containing protein [Geminicoccaceae bacterium]